MAYISSEKRAISTLMNHAFAKCVGGQTLTVRCLQGQMGHSPEDPVGVSPQKQTIIIRFGEGYKFIFIPFISQSNFQLSTGILP